jgi:hypothetical protein
MRGRSGDKVSSQRFVAPPALPNDYGGFIESCFLFRKIRILRALDKVLYAHAVQA